MKFIRDIISEKRAQATSTPPAMPPRELPEELLAHDDIKSDVKVDDEGFVLPPHPAASLGEYDDDGLADAGSEADMADELASILNPPDEMADEDEDDFVSFGTDTDVTSDSDSFDFSADEPELDEQELVQDTPKISFDDDTDTEGDLAMDDLAGDQDVAEGSYETEPEVASGSDEDNIFSAVTTEVEEEPDHSSEPEQDAADADEPVSSGWTGSMPRMDAAFQEHAEPPTMQTPERRVVEVQPEHAADEAQPVNVPAPAAGRASRRAGRVKTRLLGFNGAQSRNADPFAASAETQEASHTQFPVGWLVVIKGPGRGSAFTLFDGVAQIGRGAEQTIRLDFGDNSISRENHAAIAYDAEQRTFYLGHGGKANLVRLNDRPVLSTESLQSDDLIRIGETTLRFVALCGAEFDWNGSHQGQLKHASFG